MFEKVQMNDKEPWSQCYRQILKCIATLNKALTLVKRSHMNKNVQSESLISALHCYATLNVISSVTDSLNE